MHRSKNTTVLFGAALAATAVACGSPTKPATSGPDVAPTAPSTQTATEDMTVKVFGTTSMSLPKGWTLSSDGAERYKISGPDGELVIWMLRKKDITKDSEALGSSWREVDPDFALSEEQAVSPPPSRGWSRITQVTYETPASEQRVSIGVARTLGPETFIHLIESPMAALGRRGAQVQQLLGSFRPPGLATKDYAKADAASFDGERLMKLDQFLAQTRSLGKVSGLAVAVVADGKIVFAKGYGAEKAGGTAVGPDTLFMIGSTTKSLTTLMMARQVDAKRFAWDTPVTKVYPPFALGDAELTAKLTMETSVCACSGMPRQDMEMLFEWRGLSAADRLAELKVAVPTTGFREVFQYSNPLVSAGGFIAAGAAHKGKTLDVAYDLEMNTMFAEMGMVNTTFDYDLAQRRRHARPHGRTFENTFVEMPVDVERAIEPVRPAGAAWSSANDMARYLLIELSKGETPEGVRIVSEDNLMHRRKPQIKIGDSGNYGLGLMVGEEFGVDIVHHGGNTLGFSTDWFFLPGKNVGAVILVNGQGANSINGAVHQRLFELWFGGKERAASDFAFSLERQKKGLELALAKMSQPTPEWLAGVLGKYENDALGELSIERAGDRIIANAGEWTGTVVKTTESDGSEYVTVSTPPMLGVSFEIERSGENVVLLLKDSQKTYRFER